jgi:hypothetical protein
MQLTPLVFDPMCSAPCINSGALFQVLLVLDRADASPALARGLNAGNYVLVFAFAGDVLMRVLAAGTAYWSFGINIAEFVMLILSLADIFAQFTGLNQRNPALYTLVAVRAIRILRLARVSDNFLRVLERIALSVPRALFAFLLFMIFTLSAAIVGMQLFGGYYDEHVAAGRIPEVPRLNFNSLWWALVTVYQVADNENWNDTLFIHMAAFGPGSSFFFLVIIVVGEYTPTLFCKTLSYSTSLTLRCDRPSRAMCR